MPGMVFHSVLGKRGISRCAHACVADSLDGGRIRFFLSNSSVVDEYFYSVASLLFSFFLFSFRSLSLYIYIYISFHVSTVPVELKWKDCPRALWIRVTR